MAKYFVKTNGSDSNNGTTWALAKATAQAALNLANTAGDEVYVAPGVYNEYLTDPAASGTSGTKSLFFGDTLSNVSDGSATSGVTPGPIRFCKDPASTVQGTIYWDTTNYWKVKNFDFATRQYTTGDYRAAMFGTFGSASYGLGMEIEDCSFESSTYGAILCCGPESGSFLRRCVSISCHPFFFQVTKSTTFSANPDLKVYGCLAITSRNGYANTYGGFCQFGDGSTYGYNYVYYENCEAWMNVDESMGAFHQYNSTACKVDLVRCLSHTIPLTRYTTNATATNSYYYGVSSANSVGTNLAPTSVHRPKMLVPLHRVGSTILSPLTYTPAGEDVYDFFGGSFAKSVGIQEYVSPQYLGAARSAASARGLASFWAAGGGGKPGIGSPLVRR